MNLVGIKEVKQETSDTVTLILELPDNLQNMLKYQPGQFLTVEYPIGEEAIQRCYSLSSSPGVDKNLAITVKEIPGGKLSPVLVRELKSGSQLKISEPAGRFVLQPGSEHVFFAAGSGVTPVFSMLKAAKNQGHVVKLIYSCRDEENIIFANELRQLLSEDELEIVLSQPSGSWQGKNGRLTSEALNQLISPSAQAQYYACGPEGYMATIEQFLLAGGVSKSQFHTESFNVDATELPSDLADAMIAGDGPIEAGNATVEITVDGQTKSIEVTADESILDAAIRAKLSVPYSCMDGVCFACMAKLEAGKVAMPNDVALDEEEVNVDQKILTCQARALNSSCVVNYDEG